MSEFVMNPRRAPRAPVRCEARIALMEGGYWSSPTSDYGPRGCQVLAPMRLTPGMRIYVELVNKRVPGAVELAGRVAWIAKSPPWRAGIAFDGGSFGAADAFFARLAAAYPGIDTYGRAPDRLPTEAPLAPSLPPEVEPMLTPDETRVLAKLGAGATLAELRARLGDPGQEGLNAIFSLLGRRYLTVGPPDAESAGAWAPRLAP